MINQIIMMILKETEVLGAPNSLVLASWVGSLQIPFNQTNGSCNVSALDTRPSLPAWQGKEATKIWLNV